MISLLPVKLADELAERVRRNHHDAIVELQRLPLAIAKVLADKELADGNVTLVAHGLGRVPSFILCSPPRGAVAAGRIDESRDGTFDRTKYIGLRAVGYGASIKVDVLVL